MNNRQLYLAWLRTVAPSVYIAAIRKATGQTRNLGGLQSDLLQQALSPNTSHSFLGDDGTGTTDLSSVDLSNIDFTASSDIGSNTFAAPDFSPVTIDTSQLDASISAPLAIQGGGFTAPAVSSGSSQSTAIFTGVLQAAATVGAAAVGATSQSSLIALNSRRAAQGLPPVNSSGQVISASSLASTSPALLAFERSISGGVGGLGLLPIGIGIAGIAAFFLLRKKRK
jgi:hypothetical protein